MFFEASSRWGIRDASHGRDNISSIIRRYQKALPPTYWEMLFNKIARLQFPITLLLLLLTELFNFPVKVTIIYFTISRLLTTCKKLLLFRPNLCVYISFKIVNLTLKIIWYFIFCVFLLQVQQFFRPTPRLLKMGQFNFWRKKIFVNKACNKQRLKFK